MTTAYWWNKQPNFGDALSPLLLRHFADVHVQWAPPDEADIVCTGSVIDALPDGWKGTVAGAGVLRSDTYRDLSDATILALRGPLTWLRVEDEGSPFFDTTIADPALLVCDMVTLDPTRPNRLGVMPHWSDLQLFDAVDQVNIPKPLYINPMADPMTVLWKISQCTRLVTSSLHGVICADALGIERQARPFPSMNTIAEGSDFKWKDYGSSIGQPIEFGRWQTPNRARIEEMQEELVTMFQKVSEIHG